MIKILIRITAALIVITGLLLAGAWFYFDTEHIDLDATTRARFDETFIELPSGVVHYELAGPDRRRDGGAGARVFGALLISGTRPLSSWYPPVTACCDSTCMDAATATGRTPITTFRFLPANWNT